MKQSMTILLGLGLSLTMSNLVYAEQYELSDIEDNCIATQTNLWNGTRFHLLCEWDKFELKDANDITGGPPVPDPTVDCESPKISYDGDCVFPHQQEPIDVDVPIVDPDLTFPIDEATVDIEKIKDIVCGKDKQDADDVEACRLLQDWSRCNDQYESSVGFGRLATIQTAFNFTVTLKEPTDWKNWDLKKSYYLGQILLKYEFCRALITEHDDVLSAMYDSFIVDGILEPQVYHGDLAADIFQPALPQPITEAVHATTEKVAEKALCTLRQFQSAWDSYDCPGIEIEDTAQIVNASRVVNLEGPNIDEHRKYLENPSTYMPPVIKGWFQPGECYSNTPCQWKIEIP